MWRPRTQFVATGAILCTAGAAWAQPTSTYEQQIGATSRGAPSPWAFQASGLINHFRDARCEGCEYRSTVPGIGLQRDAGITGSSPFAYTISAGLQSDSFGRSGGYAAAVASVPMSSDSLLFRPGLGAFAFYRYMDNGGERVLVPAILPVLSVENRRSGIGATLLAAPNFTYGGTERSGFVFLQFTFRLGRS